MAAGEGIAPDRQVGPAGPDRSLSGLIELLKQAKFRVGVSAALDAARLLQLLSARMAAPPEVAMLRARLRAVLCKSLDEQSRFDPIFDAWALACGWSRPPEKTNEPTARGDKPEEGGPSPTPTPSAKAPGRRNRILAIVGILALLVLIASLFLRDESTPLAPVAPTPAKTVTTKPVTAPQVTAPAVPEPTVTQTEFFPALRANLELEPWLAWVTLGVGLALLFMVGIPAQFISSTSGRRSGNRIFLDTSPLDAEARRIVPAIAPATASRLVRHARTSADAQQIPGRRRPIDVRRTVEAAVTHLGLLELRYRQVCLRPNYLVLIDTTDENDPRGRLFYRWAERLHGEAVNVDIRLFRPAPGGASDAAPRFFRSTDNRWLDSARPTMGLDKLDDPPEDQRLIVISDGRPFVDATGKPYAWVRRAKFFRWRQRVIFTPSEYRDWSEREAALEHPEIPRDPGFLVMPLDEEALAAWSTLLVSGVLPPFTLSELERFPRLLTRGDWDPLGDEPPRNLDTLMAQLRLYLGDNGFRWLTACAVVPLVRWEITLLLGDQLFARMGPGSDPRMRRLVSLNYRRLVRLPWLRAKRFPDWLRLALLTEMPRHMDEHVRTIVRGLLDKVRQAGEGGLQLDLEPPPSTAARITPRESSKSGDVLYLGYMSGLSPRQLQLRAPTSWSKWVRKIKLGDPNSDSPLKNAVRALADRATALLARLVFRHGWPYAGPARTVWMVGGALLLFWCGAMAWLSFGGGPARARVLGELPTTVAMHWLSFSQRGPVLSLDVSSDGQLLITGSTDRTARVWDARTGALLTTVSHRAAVTNVLLSSDGLIAASLSADRTAGLWNSHTGKLLPAFDRALENVNSIALSQDGSKVVLTSGTTVSVSDLRTGKTLGELATKAEPSDAVFGPGGGYITILLASGLLENWNGTTGSAPKEGPVVKSALSFSSDGQYAAFGAADQMIHVLNTPDMKETLSIPAPDLLLETRTTDTRLAYRGTEPKIHIAAPPDGRAITTLDVPPTTGIMRFSPDGNSLLVGTTTGDLILYDLPSGRAQTLTGKSGPVRALRFTPDGQSILAASTDGTVRRWATHDKGVLLSDPGLPINPGVGNYRLSPDAKYLVTLDNRSAIRLWNANTGWLLAKDTVSQAPLYGELAFSRDSTTLAVGTANDEIALFDMPSLANPRRLKLPALGPSQYWRLDFDPTGTRLVTIAIDSSYFLWDVKTGTMLTGGAHFVGDRSGPKSKSGESLFLAAGTPRWDYYWSTGAFITYTDTEAGISNVWQSARPVTLRASFKGAAKLGVSPGERTLIAIGTNGIGLWDLATRKQIAVAQDRALQPTDFAFSPDGNSVAVVGAGQLSLFDTHSGQQLSALQTAGDGFGVWFSDDGTLLYTSSRNEVVQLWSVSNGVLASRFYSESLRVARVEPLANGTATLLLPSPVILPGNSNGNVTPTIPGTQWLGVHLGWPLFDTLAVLLTVAIVLRTLLIRRRLGLLGKAADLSFGPHLPASV